MTVTQVLEQNVIQTLFPGAVPENELIGEAERRSRLSGAHEVACITVCREPAARSIEIPIRSRFATIFDYYSLGGIPTIGNTSIDVAWGTSGNRGLAYFAFTHLALGTALTGSPAAFEGCHGLEFLLRDIVTDRILDRVDPYDWEYTLLRRAFVAAGPPPSARWDIVSLAKFMARAAGSIAWGKLEACRASDAEFSVVSGVHVTGAEASYVWLCPEFEHKICSSPATTGNVGVPVGSSTSRLDRPSG